MVALLVGAGSGVAAFALIATADPASGSGGFDTGMPVLLGGAAAMGVLLWVTDGVWDIEAKRLSHWLWIVPAIAMGIETIAGWAMFGATLEPGFDPDYSWFGVVPVVAVVGTAMAAGLSMVAMGLLATPTVTFVRHLRGAVAGDRDDRRRVLLAGVILPITPLALAIVLGYALQPSGPRDRVGVLVALFRICTDWHGWWSVVAWCCLASMVGAAVGLWRLRDSPAPERTGG